VIVLSGVGLLTAAIVWQLLAGRKWVDRRQHQAQSAWLANAGAELAAARLLADPAGYQGETVEIIPGSKVRIEVRTDATVPNAYIVTSEARYPADGPELVVRSVTRRFRRIVEKDRVRLKTLAPEPAKETEGEKTQPPAEAKPD
jgi:hypothetical protein